MNAMDVNPMDVNPMDTSNPHDDRTSLSSNVSYVLCLKSNKKCFFNTTTTTTTNMPKWVSSSKVYL
jgi:hypothetical protein